MCYSKEVQLSTGIIILIFSFFSYIFYSIKYQATEKKWLIPFLHNVILACVFIGIHQTFEFLSLITYSQIIYKIGLIFSISTNYFLIRSLEIIFNKDLKSKISLIIIGVIAIYSLLITQTFEPYSFYVRSNSIFIWACAWMLLFIYFHICAINNIQILNDDLSKKSIIIYLFSIIDISFILTAIYATWGYFRFNVNFCTDSPSIWCTFSVIQILTLPFFLTIIPTILNRPKEKTSQTVKQTILYFFISIIILLLLILILPLFNCLNFKFIFP